MAFEEIAALGRADAMWDCLFSNEALGYKCKPGDEKRRDVSVPNMGVLGLEKVRAENSIARMHPTAAVEYLGTLSRDKRIAFIERVNAILQMDQAGKTDRPPDKKLLRQLKWPVEVSDLCAPSGREARNRLPFGHLASAAPTQQLFWFAQEPECALPPEQFLSNIPEKEEPQK
jgi:hypothetical protein